MSLKQVSASKCFDGEQRVYSHQSEQLNCEMKFGVYLPPAALDQKTACPVLYFLSGLSCTQDNFIQKSGFQQHAAKHGIIVVNPDTSPRGSNLPGEHDAYDFGSGAGFYVDATVAPWSDQYKMYSYVTKELVSLVNANFNALPKRGIFGHSMGGHGALICALKNPGLYQSVSAFAPISNPIECPWGKKAFRGYLGESDTADWSQWDATRLVGNYAGTALELFIDQGSQDQFYIEKQLLPDNLLKAAEANERVQTVYKFREGYDHSYFFISTFVGEHFDYHAKLLKL